MTRTKLLQNRKLEKIPDPTYDLDMDGFVGGRDYFLAKRFDLDQDGKLNAQEKQNAYDQIMKGYEDNFVWNLENQGAKRGYRILQKRGKIIDAEDYLPVRDTYPEHPLHRVNPNVGTFTDLKEKRKHIVKDDIGQKMKRWEEANPQVFVNEPMDPRFFYKPKYTSIKQIKKENHEIAREKIGLLKEENDIKIKEKDPTLKYVYDPEFKTANNLKEKYKKENMDQFLRLNNKHYMDDVERLNLREDEVIADGYFTDDRQTLRKIKEKRRKETVEYNMKTFSKQTIGVHGHELPKFSENADNQEYWKNKDAYVDNPDLNSHALFKENIKYWKKKEELLLSDHIEGKVKVEKKVYRPKFKKNEMIIKVNNLNHFKDFDPNNPKPIDLDNPPRNHIYKWTTLVNQFAPSKFNKGRYFDALPKEAPRQSDFVPMYSSFAGDGVFAPSQLKNLGKKTDEMGHNIKDDKILLDNNLNANRDSLYQKFSSRELGPEKVDKLTAVNTMKIRTKGF